jgi:hypothetical protein
MVFLPGMQSVFRGWARPNTPHVYCYTSASCKIIWILLVIWISNVWAGSSGDDRVLQTGLASGWVFNALYV